jgi:opacity protein-like surface antigen
MQPTRRLALLLSAACLALLLPAPGAAQEEEPAQVEQEEEEEEEEGAEPEEQVEPEEAEEEGEEEDAEEEGSEYARRGGYLRLHALYAVDDFEHMGGFHVDGSLGGGGIVGYRWHERLGLEAQVEWLDRFTVKQSSVTVRKLENALVTTVNGRLYLLTGWIQPYALVGVGAAHFESRAVSVPGSGGEDTDLAVRFGWGVDLYGDANWAIDLSASYVLPAGGLADLDYASFGWGFLLRF